MTLGTLESRMGRSGSVTGSSRGDSTERILRSSGSSGSCHNAAADAAAKLAQDCLPPPLGGYGVGQPVLRAPSGGFGSATGSGSGFGSLLGVSKSLSVTPGRLLPLSAALNVPASDTAS